MNKRQIKHITNKHYREMKKHIKKIAESFDVDAIHQFRVEYKKLRAFLRMLSSRNKTTIKISGKLKKGYHISGSVRDLQLQQQRVQEATIQEFKKPQAYIDLLQLDINKQESELGEMIPGKPVDKCRKKTDAMIPDEFSMHGFSDFVQEKWDVVFSIITSGHFYDIQIHTVRKNLKDLFYNLKIHQDAEKEILSRSIWKGKNESYYFQLLDELGSFQDICTAIVLLNASRLKGLNRYNRKMLMQIKKGWLKDKEQLKQLLVKKLGTDIYQLPG